MIIAAMTLTAEIYTVNAPRGFLVHGFKVTEVTADKVDRIAGQESDADVVIVVAFSRNSGDESLSRSVFKYLEQNPLDKLSLILFGPFARTPNVPASQYCFGDHSCRGAKVYSRSQDVPDYATLATRLFAGFDIVPVPEYEDAESDDDESDDDGEYKTAPDANFCETYQYFRDNCKNKSFLRNMAVKFPDRAVALDFLTKFLSDCEENSYCGDPEYVADDFNRTIMGVIERIKVDPAFKAAAAPAAEKPVETTCDAVDRFARMKDDEVRKLVETRKECRLLQFKVHPDKNPGCANAKEASQIVNRVCDSMGKKANMKGGGTRVAATWAALAAVTVLAAFLG